MSPLRQILWAACLREGAARLVEQDGMGGRGRGLPAHTAGTVSAYKLLCKVRLRWSSQ